MRDSAAHSWMDSGTVQGEGERGYGVKATIASKVTYSLSVAAVERGVASATEQEKMHQMLHFVDL